MSVGGTRHRLARAELLAGEEGTESMSRDELEKYRERLVVVARHFAGSAGMEVRPPILPDIPDRLRFTSAEAKTICTGSFDAALAAVPTPRLEAFFNFVRQDVETRNSGGRPLTLPKL